MSTKQQKGKQIRWVSVGTFFLFPKYFLLKNTIGYFQSQIFFKHMHMYTVIYTHIKTKITKKLKHNKNTKNVEENN